MGWPQFLAWAATQGFKNIKLLRQAYNSFKKFPGKDVVLKKAKNLYDDLIKKTPTKDLTKQIRQKIKEDKTLDFNVPFRNKESIKIIEQFKKNTPPKQWEKIIENLEGIKIPKRPFPGFKPEIVPKVVKPKLKIEKSKQIIEGMKPKDPKVVNIGDRIIKQMQKEGKTVKFDDLLRIYGKKPPTLKADGGRIDKALPKKSRDI